MNLLELYFDSIHFQDVVKSVEPDTELQDIILAAQMSVNVFVGEIGQSVVSDIVADTYLLSGTEFSTDFIKYFSVCVIFHNTQTNRQFSTVFPYMFVPHDVSLPTHGAYLRGLYRNEKATSC